MKKLFLALGVLGLSFSFASVTQAEDIFRVQIGSSNDHYSNQELVQRVWQLERAVYQLQSRIFKLELAGSMGNIGNISAPIAKDKSWTCVIQSFGTTYTKTATTRGAAQAQVLRDCSEATSAMHCRPSDVKCDDE